MVKSKKEKGRGFKILTKWLSLVFIVLSFVILIYPFIPQILYWFKYDVFDYDWKKFETYNTSSQSTNSDDSENPEFKENRLLIPVIGVDVQIVEGKSEESLNLGAWHRPETGNPESGGNMVITGHRFQYLPPNNLTFYHLDKLVEGDKIIVSWNEIEYDYIVIETFIVTPESVEIEDQTANNVLTLYTCTPLWTAEKRLVVRAEPKIN